MKQQLLLLVMILLPIAAMCQESNSEKPYPVFCVVSPKTASNSLSDFRVFAVIEINEMFAHYICDEQNEQVYFQTTVDILNYMSKHGWEYVEKRDEKNSYIFKKAAVSPDEAYKSLNPLTTDEIKKAKKEKV